MAKTNPIGVRFDEDLLNTVKAASLAKSPQKALNLYEKSYLELVATRVKENNKPENKANIDSERKGDGKKRTDSGLITEVDCEIPDSAIQKEISEIERELKNPPTNPAIGLKMWKQIRLNKIKELQKQLTNET